MSENGSEILVEQVIMYTLELTFCADKDVGGVEADNWFEIPESVGARLKDTPELSFIKALILLPAGEDLVFEGDLGVLEKGIDLIVGGT